MKRRRWVYLAAATAVMAAAAGVVQFFRYAILPPTAELTVELVDGKHVSIRVETSVRVRDISRIEILDAATRDKLWIAVAKDRELRKYIVVRTDRLPEGFRQEQPSVGVEPNLIGREIEVWVYYQYDTMFPPSAASDQVVGRYLITEQGVRGRRLLR
jgi:hypothetical protein